MPDYKFIVGSLAVLLSLVNLLAYLRGVLRGTTKPHAFSWLLWAVVMAIVFCTQIASHAGAAAWQIACTAFLCGVIAIFAFRNGEKNITRGDWVALISALAAIPLWIATKDPLWSVVLLTLIDSAGYYPTLRKSFHRPFDEDLRAFFIGTFIFCLNVIAIEHYSLTTLFYPLMIIFMQVVIVTMLIIRRRHLPKPPQGEAA